MFIQASDFADIPYKIPNQEESVGFIAFIEEREAYYLKMILGIALYNDFIERYAEVAFYENLLSGGQYTYSETVYEHSGIVKLLVPAIYSDFLKINWRKLTNSGIIINNGQVNTTVVNPDVDYIAAWNDFVTKLGGYCYEKNSMYGFLKANESLFLDDDIPEWKYEYKFRIRNLFDL